MDGHDTGHCFPQLKAMEKRRIGWGGGGAVSWKGLCYGVGGGLHVSVIRTVQSIVRHANKVMMCFKSDTAAHY